MAIILAGVFFQSSAQAIVVNVVDDSGNPINVGFRYLIEEDDSFLSVGSETWDYEIAEGREREFLDAVRNSEIAIECIPLDDTAVPD